MARESAQERSLYAQMDYLCSRISAYTRKQKKYPQSGGIAAALSLAEHKLAVIRKELHELNPIVEKENGRA